MEPEPEPGGTANHDGTKTVSGKNLEPHSAQELFGEVWGTKTVSGKNLGPHSAQELFGEQRPFLARI